MFCLLQSAFKNVLLSAPEHWQSECLRKRGVEEGGGVGGGRKSRIDSPLMLCRSAMLSLCVPKRTLSNISSARTININEKKKKERDFVIFKLWILRIGGFFCFSAAVQLRRRLYSSLVASKLIYLVQRCRLVSYECTYSWKERERFVILLSALARKISVMHNNAVCINLIIQSFVILTFEQVLLLTNIFSQMIGFCL